MGKQELDLQIKQCEDIIQQNIGIIKFCNYLKQELDKKGKNEIGDNKGTPEVA